MANKVAQKVIASIRDLAAKRKSHAAKSYGQLVISIANDKEHDPEQIMELLTLAGKSHDDLLADVELVLQRREWAKDVQALETAKAKAAAARRKIDELEEKKAAAIKPFDEQIIALLDDVEGSPQYQTVFAAAITGGQRLRETVSPDLEEEIEANSFAMGEASKRLKYVRDRILEHRKCLEEIEQEIEHRDARELTGVREGERRTRQDLLDSERNHKQRISELSADESRLAKQYAELERESASLEAQRFVAL